MAPDMFHIKAVIFDLDGVICSTDQYHYLAWKELARRLKLPFDRKKNDLLRGISRLDSLDIILGQSGDLYSREEKEALAEEKNRIYKNYLKRMTKKEVKENVRSTLEKLKYRKYKLAIGSSSKNARFILQRIEMEELFDAIVDGTDIVRSKPDPEIFLRASEKLKERPENCVVVEDARSGVVAAKAAGMKAMAFFGDARGCGLEDCDLDSFSQLCDILGG